VSLSLFGLAGLIGSTGASAQVPVSQAQFSGFATGATLHTGAVSNGATTLAELDQAYAGAAVDSAGLNKQIVSEINTVVQDPAPGKNAGARGSGVELGIGQNNPIANNQLILAQKASATAAPSSSDKHNISLNGALNPILDATLLEGRAAANWPSNGPGCILGKDISNGFGHAANAQAVGSGGGSPTVNAPGDATDTSRMVMVPQQDKSGTPINGGGVGLMADNVQTIAPVGLLGGAITVTVLAPWHLRAVAGGVPGSAFMDFGPNTPNADAPALTIEAGLTKTQITLNQLLGPNGFTLTVPGLATITIATKVHAIGGSPTSDAVVDPNGTTASGAADIVHINLSLGALTIADFRLGHMEASATVPAGGILCQIDVSKTAQPTTVNPGDSFTYTINVHNPHACTLTNVKVVDTITLPSGVRVTVGSPTPPPNSNTGTVLTWNDIGPIAPDETKTITVPMTVARNSGGGVMTEKADVTASCAIGNAAGSSQIAVPAAGSATIQAPNVSGGAGRALPVTGGPSGRYYAVALLIALSAIAVGRRGLKVLASRA
jgi:uncharacterized repeat protein (TIGR01451 family)